MSAAKYTPGPWESHQIRNHDFTVFRSSDKRAICDIDRAKGWGGAALQKRSKADARLIAAAPEMLEALQEVVAYCEQTGNDWMCLLDARKAIAKATGSAS